MQRELWSHSTLSSVRTCGRIPLQGGGFSVKVSRTPDGRRVVGFGGLMTCGSVWACPECSVKVTHRRASDIAQAVQKWEASGGRVALVTLTMRHKKSDPLADLWAGQSSAWQAVTMGNSVRRSGWYADADAAGTPTQRIVAKGSRRGQAVTENRIHYVKCVEVTHGANGWHVHVHALVFLRADADLDALGKSMFSRWRARLQNLGLRAPIASKGGLDARWMRDADEAVATYLTKGNYADAHAAHLRAGYEVAGGSLKSARGQNVSPWVLLQRAVDRADWRLWHEFEQGSKGRHQLTWSNGFRDVLGLGADASDEEIAAEEFGGDVVCIIGQNDPQQAARAVYWKADIARFAEHGLYGGLADWLQRQGLSDVVWWPDGMPTDP